MKRLLLLAPFVLAATLPLLAQDAAIATPTQTSVAKDAALNPALPTVFIVGDSTARNQADLGWGDHFAPFFDLSRINVANRAIAGRSSRSYITEGHWSSVLAEMKSGDFLLLQMGHNDSGSLDGAKPRGSLKGLGEETKDLPQTVGPYAGKTETVHTYGWYMRKMIDEAKAKGVTVALLTVTIRDIWKPGPTGQPQIEADMGYRNLDLQLAAQEHIPLVDLATVEAARLQALGETKAAALYPRDHTHTSAEGAAAVAHDVTIALRNAHSPLIAYLH